ncbi:MAG: glycosyltransferase family 2 protein [Patescibacteria group bacterium]
MNDYYLKIGNASDLKNPKERAIFRFFEILPGLLSWGTLITIVVLSWLKPVWMAIFIIAFVVYWFFRAIYFYFHLRSSYRKMRINEKIDWLEKLNKLKLNRSPLLIKAWQDIYHLVILPIYKEPFILLQDTLTNLKLANYPKEKMIVVLSAEERARQHLDPIVNQVKEEFSQSFFKFLITWHPANLKGEIPGHGSNDAWGAKVAKKLVIDTLKIPYENIIVSSFDVDTCVFPDYFSCLTYYYLKSKKPTRTSFQPIPLYINNIWQAPALSRTFAFSSTFWQMMCQERPEKLLTFSSHAMSFKAMVDVGFKQTNVISDDSRIFWQCFFKYDGDYRVQPIFYPLAMDANVAQTFWRTIINIYKQQRRWAWGVGEIAFFLFGALKNRKIPFSKKFSRAFDLFEGHWSWANASIIIFCLGWLPLILGGVEFSQTIISYNLPRAVSFILTFSMLGIVGSAYFSILLLPPKPLHYGRSKYFIFFIQWFFLPLIMIFFSALPALDAQTRWILGKYMGFWPTEKVRK